ncbi:hypothetical protein ACFVXE_25715 [Streptomyces sp. NPDC058231]|uniref:hypothetical protein n=1 Tax=Streptomyces sp. NPDC058231 TaxID=3346392 RepID=UPI0036EFBA16
MSVARRLLLTATVAGTLLCALWFVPSANATEGTAGAPGPADRAGAEAAGPAPDRTGTGGADTTAWLIGGTALLGAGATYVVRSPRRSARPDPAGGRV